LVGGSEAQCTVRGQKTKTKKGPGLCQLPGPGPRARFFWYDFVLSSVSVGLRTSVFGLQASRSSVFVFGQIKKKLLPLVR
jgi:hypothetical protein